jgi:SAM-dependent methyltransferase
MFPYPKRFLSKIRACAWVIRWYQNWRIRSFESLVKDFLADLNCVRVLDLGPNTCVFSSVLVESGYDVTLLDIKDCSVIPGLRPVIYEGERFPFPDGSFDCGLAISMLHHVPDPMALLRELHRVCDFVVVQEDLVSTWWRTVWMYLWDSLVNCEFLGHPHSNKTDADWKRCFADSGFQLHRERFYFFQGVPFGLYALRSLRMRVG